MPVGGSTVYLEVLGPLRLWRDGAELDPGPRQQAYLLALLLARAGRPTSTGELIDLIWGDDAPASALNVIHKYVGALRRTLEPLLPARENGSFLHRRGNAYVFTAEPDRLDLLTFRRLAAVAGAEPHRETALGHYAEALALWRGPAGNGVAGGTGAATVFAALDDEFYAACTAAAELAVATGRPEPVLPALRLAASMAPFHEPVQAGLVAALGAAGLQAEALSVYRTVRGRLADELGIDPGAALEAAHRRVLAQTAAGPDPAAGATTGAATTATHGATATTAAHDATGHATTAHGATTTAAHATSGADTRGADTRGAATVAVAAANGEVWAGAGPALVGRVEELAMLRQAVEGAVAGRTAVAVVEGEPGVGKTRLLEEAAALAARLGALTVWGTCLEGDGTPAMWPWEQALGRLVEALPAAAREQRLAGELGLLLDSRGLGLLLEPGNERVRDGSDSNTRLGLPQEPRDDAGRGGSDGSAVRGGSDSNARFRLFEQVVALVGQASAQRPTVLILDDLQWADAASLQLFQHLATRLPAGAAIVGALRDRAPAPHEQLAQVLAKASRVPGHRRFRLGPLGLADVTELVRREAGLDPDAGVARAIHARTAGNPFFVRELSRLLDEAGALRGGDADAPARVPSTVRDVVRDRMAGLDERARDLLQVAALIGRDVDLRLLSRASGVPVADCLDRLEPLQALGLLEAGPADPSALRFAHDLVRESVSETTAAPKVVRLHLRVADALEAVHADDEAAAERLAFHLWAAGPLADPERTAGALIRAGRRAANRLAFESADRHLRSAVQVARTTGRTELELDALTLLAIVLRRQAGYDASIFDLLERAEYLAMALGRDAEAADFLFIRVMGAYTAMERERGRLAKRMHERGEASSDPAIRRYGRQAWGLHQWDIGNIGEAHRSFTAEDDSSTSADTPLRRDGAIPGEGPGWRAVTTALHGDVETALAFVDSWDAPGDPYAASVWVYYTTMIASMAGDAGRARRAGERWVAAGLDRLRSQIDHYIRQNWCWARALTGDDPAGAAAEAEELLAASLLDPPQWGVAYQYGLIAEMWLAAGMPDRAADALARADAALWDHGQRYAEGLLLLVRARLAQARGEPAGAVRQAAEQARERSAAVGSHLFAARAERFLAELEKE
ncbi:BTAD domain-containing putative transcriptional regulator [Dactylosporangium sp. CS-033363]|uniref:BTAD domain-containing putative transcriptional regulator n=1 Tax=Dactylosporangium sp. CS-033363 TaxID=3239935 RepID=UPI003D9427EA